jgi:signal transduction histidine kinase
MPKSLFGKMGLVLVVQSLISAGAMIYFLGIMINDAATQRTVVKVVLACLSFSLAIGLLFFRPISRRVKRLAELATDYQASNFSGPVQFASVNPNGDEIDRLEHAVSAMASRMAEQVKKLQSNDVQRRELIANVSHDLRTPLASMRGYLETVLLKQGTISLDEQRSYIEVAAKQSERLAKLVANLFELTKLEVSEVALNSEPFSVAELAQDVIQKFELPSAQKDVTVSAEITGTVPMVIGDISLIERVLENLIDNALRHCAGGAAIRVRVERKGDYVEIKVADTGSGIATEDLPKVFDRFYQSGRNQGGNAGAGLGLAISKRILDLHQTNIQVQSVLGSGTTFSFSLPVAPTRAA